jgi:hypothetical protein
MSDVKSVNPVFQSAVFPTEEDMQIWNSLTPQEQRAAIRRDIDEGLRGPAAADADKASLLAEVKAERKRAL